MRAIDPSGPDGEPELRGKPGAGIGVWYGLWAYGLWGVLPIYWKWLKAVPSTQLLCHRVIWSFLALLAIILVSGQGVEGYRHRPFPSCRNSDVLVGFTFSRTSLISAIYSTFFQNFMLENGIIKHYVSMDEHTC